MSMNKSKTPLLTSDAPQIVRHFFWINLGLIALFMVLFLAMVEFTESQSERASLQHWLTAEAEQYEQDFAKQGRLASLPNSNQFDIYWSDSNDGQNPQWLTAYQQVGFYEHHLAMKISIYWCVRTRPDKVCTILSLKIPRMIIWIALKIIYIFLLHCLVCWAWRYCLCI
ncbi:hypothetical protein THIOSC13_1340002 [uncultured Thiomicrorhabdus sp.]